MDIPAGSSTTFTVDFPSTAGVPGQSASIALSGAYSGGTFSSLSFTVLPVMSRHALILGPGGPGRP